MDVSIIVTAYNYKRYLVECIKSCLMQECSGVTYEVLVIDDGSTDGTWDMLNTIEHSQLKKIHIKNSGVEVAANTAFMSAKGRYVVRLDADDLLLPGYLREIGAYIDGGDWSFIYGNYNVIDSKGCFIEQINLPEFDPVEILARGDFLATGTLYKLDVLAKIGYYNTAKRNSGLENYELIIKLLRNGHTGLHIDASVFSYRQHTHNMSLAKKNQIISNGQEIFKNFSLGPYKTNEFHPYKLRLA